MKIKSIILLLALATCSTIANAKFFFNNKCQIIGITDNSGMLTSGGYAGKFFINNIDFSNCVTTDDKNRLDAWATLRKLNSTGAGKAVLDYLLKFDGNSISEDLLLERAYRNRSLYDEEIAKADIKAANRESLERLLKENYIDILKNNYIYLQSTNEKGTKIYWAIYHVDIDDETWKNVLSSVNDKYAYYMIRVNVSLIGSGKSKGKNSRLRNRLLRDISKKITPFAIHGQVTREGGFGAYVGESSGIRHNDRMFIYRQKGEGENARSVKVATARVTNTNLEECKLYTIAGGFANSKKGDIAVLREDTRNNLSIYGLLEKDAYTANFMYDHAANYTSIGTATHFLLHLGAGVFKNYNDYKYAVPLKEYNGNTYVFHAPVIVQLGVGFGYSWTALHRFNIMPYCMVQCELLSMGQMKTDSDVLVNKYNEQNKTYSESYPDMLMGVSFKAPIGIRLSANIAYPMQIFAGAEYNFFNLGINDSKNDTNDYETIKMHYLDPSGYKRTGLNMYAGIRLCL